MYTNRTTAPSQRLVATVLSATLAIAGLGIAPLGAFADETAPQDPTADETAAPQQASVTATALTYQTVEDPQLVNADAALPTFAVEVALTNDTAEATALYDAIDALRAEQGIGALQRDPLLEQAAYQRAAEVSLLNANIRPNGTYFTTVDGYGISQAEIVVTGNKEAALDAASVLAAALETNQPGLLTELPNAGIACAEDAAGATYWVVLLSSGSCPAELVIESVVDGDATYRVDVSSANLVITSYGSDLTVETGVETPAPMPATTTGGIAHGTSVATFSDKQVNLAGSGFTWNSSDPAVATANANGAITGYANGTCTISAAGYDGLQFLFNTTVTGGDPAASIVNLADCTVAGILGSYEYTGEAVAPAFTVINPNNVTVDPSQYAYEYANNVEPGTASLTITAVEGATVVTGSAVKTFEITPPPTPQYPVPSVTGYYAESAAQTITDAGFQPYLAQGEPASDDASAGMVYATDPVAETLADAGSTITLYYYAAPIPAEPEGDPQPEPEADPQADPTADPNGANDGAPEELGEDVDPVDLSSATLTLNGTEFTYNEGNPIEPAVTVTLTDGTVLQQGIDYEVSYANNIDVSTADVYGVVTVTGIGAYTGTASTSFTIVEPAPATTDLAGAGFSIGTIDPQFYVGIPIEPAVALNGPVPLEYGIDWTVAYENNDAPGTATVTVTGLGAYSGTLTTTFQINGDIAQATVGGITDQVYNGTSLTPAPTVTFGSKLLTKDTDYTLEYTNNRNAGTATVTVIGRGNYAGSTSATFVIAPKSIKDGQISPIPSVQYTGSAATPALTVTDGTTVLANGTDYQVTYENNVNAGTAHVVVTGIGNYQDALDTTFVIAPLNMNRTTVVMPNQYYTGQALMPKPVSVTIDGLTLVEGTDYDVVGYGNNVNVGNAKVTLQGKGNFTGTVMADWKIVQQGSGVEAGATETLPATGDTTNLMAIAVGAVIGVALVIAAVALILHRRKVARQNQEREDSYYDYHR